MPVTELTQPQTVIFGEGASEKVAGFLKGLAERVLVVRGAVHSFPEFIFTELQTSGLTVKVFTVEQEPTLSLIEEGIRIARESGVQAVLAVGGGSVIDAGKAIAGMIPQESDLREFLEVVGKGSPVTQPGVPLIAVPTTAGTGSEVTRNAVISIPSHRVKVSLRGKGLMSHAAIVDPLLTWSVPPQITASTGMDALTQLIEPFVSNRANPLTDPFCRDGIRKIGQSLERAYRDGKDGEARSDMALASLFGGIALANSGLGAVHGFASPIGGMFAAPHGMICARLLAPVVRANAAALRESSSTHPVLDRYREAFSLFTGQNGEAEDLADELEGLRLRLEIPGLSYWGVQDQDVDVLVDLAELASSMKANPIRLPRETLAAVLRSAL